MHETIIDDKDIVKTRKKWRRLVLILLASGITLSAAVAIDFNEFFPPPDDDVSAFGPLLTDGESHNFGAPAYQGSIEGSSIQQVEQNKVIQEDNNGEFKIPTGGAPSPLFDAVEFNQKMFRFEEFGSDQLAGAPAGPVFPSPQSAVRGPVEQELDDFLCDGPVNGARPECNRGLSPFPMEFANEEQTNPWEPEIADFLGRSLDSPPAEGRPPGKGWAHQRWREFNPRVFFTTATAEARDNGGMRDCRQRHGYGLPECGRTLNGFSEFQPGGLYHDTTGRGNNGTTRGIPVAFHPGLPVQQKESLWTFDGTFPPKLAVSRYGEPVLLRHYNALPIDPAANRGFGLHTLSTHEHNGHNPAESDGFASSFFFPGQFYDYRWPMQLAGHDTINTNAQDPRAGYPCEPGEKIFVNDQFMNERECQNGRINIRGDWRETMSTHWFHDHMLDFTAPNVYKGSAAMYNYYSALDRGSEGYNDGVNLNLPSGSALPWGNRDYDVNLVLADKAWDQSGQLWFNIFNLDGFVGDQLLTNWQYKPFLDVRPRRYRFRILNGSVSRYFALAMVKQVEGDSGEFPGPSGSGVSYDRVPFHMLANDGNIMEHTIPFDGSTDLDADGNLNDNNGILPTLAIAERYDIIVDFANNGLQPGDKIYMVNTLEHKDGRGPSGKISLRNILSKTYKAVQEGNRWVNGDPVVGKFLEFRIAEMGPAGPDRSMNPADFEPGGQKLIPLTIDRNDPQLQNAPSRHFEFGRSSGTDESPWTIKTDGGGGLAADPRRLSAAPQLKTGPTSFDFSPEAQNADDDFGRIEIWNIKNGGGGWSHPIHVHFEEGVILNRDGAPPPKWEQWARKDVYRVGPADDESDTVQIAIRFREFAGTFMEHCHNTQHEDHAMLLRWDVEHPGQVKLMPTPIPTWDGVEYVNTHALPTFRCGSGLGTGIGNGRDDCTIDPPPVMPVDITVDGSLTDWTGINAVATDPDDITGDNNRINWKQAFIANNDSKLYIAFENYTPINPLASTGVDLKWGWQVLIDTDKDPNTGFKNGGVGADYIVQGNYVSRYTGSGTNWSWEALLGPIGSAYSGNLAELSIDLARIGNPNSISVAFRGDNRAFGGSQTDLLPDDINSFIEYDLAGNNTGDVTSNALTTPITVDALVTDWAGVTRFGVDPSEAPDTSSAMDLRNVAMSHDATSVNILYDMYNPIEGTNSGGRFLSWGWQTYLDTDQDTSTGYRVSSIGVDYLVEGYAVSRYTGDGTSWSWELVGVATGQSGANFAELTFPRSLIGNPSEVRVISRANNRAIGGTLIDYYPDGQIVADSPQQFFKYSFGGAEPPPPTVDVSNLVETITVNGTTDDWNGLTPFANDPEDMPTASDYIDWKSATMAHNADTLYFLYRNHGAINPARATGTFIPWGWQTYLDTDDNAETGFKVGSIGADYILQATSLRSYSGSNNSWSWTLVSPATTVFNNDVAELSVPLASLGNPSRVRVLFKGNNLSVGGEGTDSYPENANLPNNYFSYVLSDVEPPALQ